jgi:hypothetical protein
MHPMQSASALGNAYSYDPRAVANAAVEDPGRRSVLGSFVDQIQQHNERLETLYARMDALLTRLRGSLPTNPGGEAKQQQPAGVLAQADVALTEMLLRINALEEAMREIGNLA